MKFDFAERRAELEAERNEALAKLPEARRAYETAFRAQEDAQAIWSAFCAHVNRSLRRSESGIQTVDVTQAVADLINDKRAEYHRAGAVLSKAKANLADLRWIIECRNLDLEQMDLLEHPAAPPIEPAAPRSKPVTDVDEADIIIFPTGSRAA